MFDVANFESLLRNKTISGVVLLVLIYLFSRFILVNVVKAWALKDSKNKQSWLAMARRIPVAILFIGILFIWGRELREFALSLVAVAAALVIATKEVILCLMGGLLKSSTKLFEKGDRIAVDGRRGKVIDHTLLTTTMMEIGPSEKLNQNTGRVLKLPNSLFLSHMVSVVPSSQTFIHHLITMTLPLGYDWEDIEKSLLESAKEVSADYRESFSAFKKRKAALVKELNLNQDPRVIFDVNAKDSLDVSLRLTVPYEGLSVVENKIVKSFMDKLSELKPTTTQNLDT